MCEAFGLFVDNNGDAILSLREADENNEIDWTNLSNASSGELTIANTGTPIATGYAKDNYPAHNYIYRGSGDFYDAETTAPFMDCAFTLESGNSDYGVIDYTRSYSLSCVEGGAPNGGRGQQYFFGTGVDTYDVPCKNDHSDADVVQSHCAFEIAKLCSLSSDCTGFSIRNHNNQRSGRLYGNYVGSGDYRSALEIALAGGQTHHKEQFYEKCVSAPSINVSVSLKTSAHPRYGSGSSFGYVVDGVQGATIRATTGAVYTFDQSDSTNNGHQIRFYEDEDRSVEITTVSISGTPGSAGSSTTLEIGFDKGVIWYQCENHALMGGSIVVSTTETCPTQASRTWPGCTNNAAVSSNSQCLVITGSLASAITTAQELEAAIQNIGTVQDFVDFYPDAKILTSGDEDFDLLCDKTDDSSSEWIGAVDATGNILGLSWDDDVGPGDTFVCSRCEFTICHNTCEALGDSSAYGDCYRDCVPCSAYTDSVECSAKPMCAWVNESCRKIGCLDSSALNYDSVAQVSAECVYETPGCTDPAALNYESSANTSDGTCLYDGCMDPTALNYDPIANNDTSYSTCTYHSYEDLGAGKCVDDASANPPYYVTSGLVQCQTLCASLGSDCIGYSNDTSIEECFVYTTHQVSSEEFTYVSGGGTTITGADGTSSKTCLKVGSVGAQPLTNLSLGDHSCGWSSGGTYDCAFYKLGPTSGLMYAQFVAINSAGNILAVSGHDLDRAYVYMYDEADTAAPTNWIEVEIPTYSNDRCGPVKLNYEGDILFVSQALGTNAVEAWQWDGVTFSNWTQLGSTVFSPSGSTNWARNNINCSSDGTRFMCTTQGQGATVHELVDGDWVQLGGFFGSNTSAHTTLGLTICMSGSGEVFGVGDNNSGNKGWVAPYEWNGSSFSVRGSQSEMAYVGSGTERLGYFMVMDYSGDTWFVSGPWGPGDGGSTGYINIYTWDGSTYNIAHTLLGFSDYGFGLGYRMATNHDGTILAASDRFNYDSNRGYVHLYQNTLGTWSRMDAGIHGAASGVHHSTNGIKGRWTKSQFGYSIEFANTSTTDKLTMIVGAPKSNDNKKGYAEVYHLDIL